MNEIRIPYQARKSIFILAVAFFAACAGIMGHAALTNEQGLVVNHIFAFSPQGASVVYWVIAAAAGAFVLLGVLALLKSIGSKREVVLSDTAITAPKNGLGGIDVTVVFSDITRVTVQTIQKTRLLTIDHKSGKLSIPNTMLPDRRTFDELVAELQARLPRK